MTSSTCAPYSAGSGIRGAWYCPGVDPNEQRIARLPGHVVDQIAAGEVIERPASVVKELVDNAIDAGARTIIVEVAAGGRSLVRVADDGVGMSPRDAVLAFERHATSKLRSVDELWGLATMGFRGEALPSIASVARVVLTTRRSQDVAATRIEVEAGRVVSVGEVGAPAGTTVEVADLLFNVPARLKFLKSDATEASHVTELVARFAMAHPTLHLRLRQLSAASPGGRTALELPPDRDHLARARALLGPRVAARLVPALGEEGGIRVACYLAAPELAQTTARGVQIFVGRRAVRDRGVLHALTMGYGELVPRGRYPVAVVMIDAPPGAVDVNVHPQKHEVRFADPAAVAAAVRHVVQAGVAAAPWREEAAGPIQMTAIASSAPPALPFDAPATPLAQRYARELARGVPAISQGTLGFDRARSWVNEIHRTTARGRAADRRAVLAYEARAREPSAGVGQGHVEPVEAGFARGPEASRETPRAGWGAMPEAPGDEPTGDALDRPDHARAELASGVAAEPATWPEGSHPTARGYFSQLRYLGQVDLTYLVCEAQGELVLVDQHAAHERVELARLLERTTASDAVVQKLLFPVTVEATPAQLELVARAGELLARVGFEAEPFGKATLAIKAMPAGIRHGDPAQLLLRLLDDWARDGTPTAEQRLVAMLAEIACHSVVRAGDRLAAGEAESLLRSLDAIDLDAPVPHGRALLLRLPLSEIGRRFGRPGR
jgi:DNA mismatch repair protein MutL